MHHPESCQHCGKPLGAERSFLAESLPAPLRDRFGAVQSGGRLCHPCVFAERTASLLARLENERGELGALERKLAERAAKNELVAANIDAEFERSATLADRAADGVARRGGSWTFVILMSAGVVVWMAFNALRGPSAADPFPFILLNLLLSCVAALQAPILLMSANRQSAHDRRKADQDFLVNLKAEIEVASLHDKLDHLLHVQWERLLELQALQIEMLDAVLKGEPIPTPPARRSRSKES